MFRNTNQRRTILYTKRRERELTLAQVEAATGIAPPVLSMYERALVEPLVTNALKLAKFYNSTVEELFS